MNMITTYVLEDLKITFRDYENALKLRVELPPDSKKNILTAAVYYLAAEYLPDPGNNSFHISAYHKAKESLLKHGISNGNSAAKNIISVVKTTAKEHDFVDETIGSVFYDLIKELSTIVTDNFSEITNALKTIEIKADFNDLKKYTTLLPPQLDIKVYAESDQEKYKPWVERYNEQHDKFFKEKNETVITPSQLLSQNNTSHPETLP